MGRISGSKATKNREPADKGAGEKNGPHSFRRFSVLCRFCPQYPTQTRAPARRLATFGTFFAMSDNFSGSSRKVIFMLFVLKYNYNFVNNRNEFVHSEIDER